MSKKQQKTNEPEEHLDLPDPTIHELFFPHSQLTTTQNRNNVL